MRAPTRGALRGPWRRRLFWAWVAASAVVGAYIGIAGPLVDNTGGDPSFVALAVPPLMFFMLATGIAWLVLFVVLKPRRPSEGAGEKGAPGR